MYCHWYFGIPHTFCASVKTVLKGNMISSEPEAFKSSITAGQGILTHRLRGLCDESLFTGLSLSSSKYAEKWKPRVSGSKENFDVFVF